MKFQLRLVAGLWLACLIVVGAFAYFQFVEDRERLTAELDRRASLVSEGLKEALEPAMGPRISKPHVERLIKKFSKPDLGVAVYDRVASLITERRVSRPWGLDGGEPGAAGENWLLPGGDESRAERLPDKCTIQLKAGDVMRMLTPGGGGWRRAG